jgi:protein-disulfide isomerase
MVSSRRKENAESVVTRVVAWALAAILVAPAALAGAQQTKDEWVEELLLQLAELRQAQGELAKQVATLQTQVATLGSGGSAAARAPAGPFDLNDGTFPVLGNADAKVAIVEFSDFQCPFCRRHHANTVPTLVDKYVQTGDVKYVFVDFPLSFHADAEPAALAAACADEQGSFWPMHDQLFATQATLGPAMYRKLAGDLKLDSAKFERCLTAPATKARIAKHVALGEAMGVGGTPAFLIGRVQDGKLVDAVSVSGAQPLSEFDRVLTPLLHRGQ